MAKKEEKKEPMGFGMILFWIASGIGCIFFVYYFKQAKYDLARTEAILLDRCRSLPFYWPPGPKQSEKNTRLDGHGLPPDVQGAFTEWFIVNDLHHDDGVTRDDVLELLRELGFEESDPACRAFLGRGEGHLEERRRLTGCGLQEALALLAEVAVPVGSRQEGWGNSRPGLIRQRLGPEVVELLRRKCGGVTPVLSSVSLMQQAMTAPGGGGHIGASPDPFAARAAPNFARAGDMAEVDDMDDETHRQLEVARLERIEANIMQRLQRAGELTPAEEGRLRDARQELARLK